MSTPEPGEQPKRRRFLSRWLPSLVVLAVVAGLATVLLGRANAPGGSSPSIGGGSADTSGWQTYHDRMNLFSLRMPPGWTAQVTTNNGTVGDNTGSMSVTTENVVLSDPTQGDVSAKMFISAESIDSAFARHWYSQAWPGSQYNTTFHGIPAQHFDQTVWLFNSAGAHFQLDVMIPGVISPPMELGPITVLPPTPTPLPANQLAADRADINGMLATFRPSNPAPLSCP